VLVTSLGPSRRHPAGRGAYAAGHSAISAQCPVCPKADTVAIVRQSLAAADELRVALEAQAIFFRRRHQPRRPPIFRVMIALNYPWR
jgi:hypothetical protein